MRDVIVHKNDINTEIEALRQVLENPLSTESYFQELDQNIGQYIRPLTADLYAQHLVLAIPQKPSQRVQEQKDFNFIPIRFTSEL